VASCGLWIPGDPGGFGRRLAVAQLDGGPDLGSLGRAHAALVAHLGK